MKYVAIGAVVLFCTLLIIAGPFLTIAAVNTLFGMSIAYTFPTWLSVSWLNLTTFGGLSMAVRSLKKG